MKRMKEINDLKVVIERIEIDPDITAEEANDLGIILGDLYEMCMDQDISSFVVIENWDELKISRCMEIAISVVKNDNEPLFLVISKEDENIQYLIGVAATNGFVSANHLCYLENHYVMIKYNQDKFRTMNKKFFERVQKFEEKNKIKESVLTPKYGLLFEEEQLPLRKESVLTPKYGLMF